MKVIRAGLITLAVAIAEEPGQFFDKRVAPILTRRCLGCHNDEMRDGDISFTDRESLLKGGKHGPAITPGKPQESALVRAIGHDNELKMPPGPKLPAREIKILTDWIQRGAPWGTKMRSGQ